MTYTYVVALRYFGGYDVVLHPRSCTTIISWVWWGIT